MSKLGDAKLLGGIGSILLLIPGVSIVGYILILVACKYVSDELADKSIFDDMLYAVIAGIVGVAAAAFIIFSALSSSLSFGGSVLAGLVIAWLALIASAVFIRRAYDKMASRLNIGYFKTAGLLYLIGAVTAVILVGFIILFIAAIFQIIAFWGIPSMAPGMQAQSPAAPMATSLPAGMKYCSSCGAQLPASATFCGKCGAKQSM